MSAQKAEAGKITDGPNEATGYAYFSTDLERAFSNAIDNARAKFHDNFNVVVKTTGFFAAGSPIGIAATYVTVEKV